jgi:hypothetical protein
MIAWEIVCTSKHEGGLGVKNLEQQNISLLLKFIHKYHTQPDCSWAKWIRNSVYSNQKRIGDKINKTTLAWRQLMQLIDLYRAMTIVTENRVLEFNLNSCNALFRISHRDTYHTGMDIA